MEALVELRGATGKIPLQYLKDFERASLTRSGFDSPGPGEDTLLRNLRAVVKRYPTPEASLALGLLMLDEGEFDLSESLRESVLEGDPDSAEALNGLAVLQYDWAKREPERAYGHRQHGLSLLRQAQARAPEDPRLLYNFGMFYEALKMRGPVSELGSAT
jgi:tetratricopeptide (TPR) repeat protein